MSVRLYLGGLSKALQASYSVCQSCLVGFLSGYSPNMFTCSLGPKIVGLYVNGLSFFGVGGRLAASGLGAAVVV